MSASPPAAAEPAPPLEAAELAALLDRLGPFERPPRLAVAVSGGPDSLALVLLAEAWARARGGCVRALHVDHGLRPGSAAEAARLVGWLAARGIPCRVLAWLGPHPSSRLQESARAARLALLEAACAEAGILHLLLAHHADDQRETVAMRRARRSGPDGLAGMAAVRETGRVRLLRPLLGVPKARLVATLLALGQPWLEDPGNLAPAFERGRLRQAGQGGGAELEAIAACGRERAAREAALARLAGRILRPDPARGTLELDADGLDRAVPELALGLLRRALAAVGGRTYPPSPAAAARLLAALVPGAPPRRSLGGCLLRRRGPRLLVAPEPARARPRPAGPAPVLAGAPFAPMLLEGTCRLCMIGEAASGSVPGAGGSAGGAVLRDR